MGTANLLDRWMKREITMQLPIRILLADAHPVVRIGLQTIITSEPDLQLVGEASTGPELVRKIRMTYPDVVVLDFLLPNLDLLTLLPQIQREQAALRFLVLTEVIADERAVAIIKAGVTGYVSKTAPVEQVLQAIRAVAAGQCPLDPAIAQRLVSAMNQKTPLPTTITPLNPREIEVLILVAHGLTNREIAKILVVSERTVGNHISTILSKLHVGNRTQAALYALRAGLTTIPEQVALALHDKPLGCNRTMPHRLSVGDDDARTTFPVAVIDAA